MGDSSSGTDFRAEIDAALAAGRFAAAREALGKLWRSRPGLALTGYVTSAFERIRPHVELRKCRVAICRSFTLEPVAAVLAAAAAVNGIDVEAELGDFNVYTQEILDAQSRLYAFKPDVAFLAIQTRDIAPELWTRFGSLDASQIDVVVDRVVSELRALVRAFRERSMAQLFVHNFELPVRPTLGLLDSRRSTGQKAAIARLNAELEAIAREQAGVHVLDYDGLVARHGRAAFHDEAKWLSTRMPLASSSIVHLADEWLRVIHPVVGKSCKVLVTDLDNTLWGGVVGEDGPSKLALGVEYPGATFQAIQRALLDLRARGILLAIASKNNPPDALEVIDGHPEMLLRSEHFSSMRISWNDKAQSLREIAIELNLGLDALAFLDDNPTEREWVREQLPQVTVLDLPRDPLEWANVVLSAPVFERLSLSSEDLERSAYYAADRQREQLKQSTGSLEDFLRDLKTTAEVAQLDAATLPRIAQLTQKTNQFNLSTRRYTEQELAALQTDPSWHVLHMRVRDRFGDHGLVGVALGRVDGDTCEIDTFLLSCRVIGRTVETAFLSVLASVARQHGARKLVGWFRPTAKNAPARDFFQKHGFTQTELVDGASFWSLDLMRTEVPMPTWIDCTVKSE
ncbi:MAG: HAD-IIIC family phosphatase [Polyangiaceae bacterium]